MAIGAAQKRKSKSRSGSLFARLNAMWMRSINRLLPERPIYFPGRRKRDERNLRPEILAKGFAEDIASQDQNAERAFLEAEREYIANWSKKTGSTAATRLTGLALSGGGIRSATFSLGVLQAFAKHDILRRFDYLSTVSGGGYIGGSLTWWLNGPLNADGKQGVSPTSFPYGTSDPTYPDGQDQKKPLIHLRNNANYLVPGAGIGYLSGVSILLRAIFLNLIVWIPLATAAFALMIWLGEPIDCFFVWLIDVFGGQVDGITNPVAGLLDTSSNSSLPQSQPFFNILIWIGIGALLLFAAASLEYGFFTWVVSRWTSSLKDVDLKKEAKPKDDNYRFDGWVRWGSFVVAVAAIAAGAFYWKRESLALPDTLFGIQLSNIPKPLVIALGLVFALAIVAWFFRWLWRTNDLNFVYGARRFFERLYGKILLTGLVFLAIGCIPLIVAKMDELALTNTAGVLGVVLGTVSGIWGHLQSVSNRLGKLGPGIVLPVGSVLLFFGIAILAYQLANFWLSDGNPELHWVQNSLSVIVIIALLSGLYTNINQISPHQFYRDRLMEAYMPDDERVELGIGGSAKRAERFPLAQSWRHQDPTGPFPIINSNVILINSAVRKFRVRGGDSFILTPFLCGSSATGWESTRSFARGRLTLASAMAISGAAANPNSGVGGKGLTRNRFISAVMTLLNLRLGFWVRRPSGSLVRMYLNQTPDHFSPGFIHAIPGNGYHENCGFFELSDGGHFENLGLYELVRRRCRLIVVCDGGQDVEASYSDFVTAVRRIEEDFGAEVSFENGGPERMIARPVADDYPKDADYAEHGFLWATIKYHRGGAGVGPAEGLLVYLKTTMIRDLGIKAKGYKGAHPDFPDQSTGDQFFDEEQFEAYREVGFRIADSLCRDTAFNFPAKLAEIKGRRVGQ